MDFNFTNRHKNVIVLVGSQGSGKSTLSKTLFSNYFRISQDDMGDNLHYIEFINALRNGVENILVDRINHTIEQRRKFLITAKEHNYKTSIIWLDVPFEICLKRIKNRKGHKLSPDKFETALRNYYYEFQEPEKTEADMFLRILNG